ncbi:hypothetical protein R3P38DRAFT_2788084 [Favolaschia claudopus]|uniref:Uncharacterized protein n=1 Tax=Favolaschia claudopus TaxID=2862362 RepID=A0AAW0AL50_9AGAR
MVAGGEGVNWWCQRKLRERQHAPQSHAEAEHTSLNRRLATLTAYDRLAWFPEKEASATRPAGSAEQRRRHTAQAERAKASALCRAGAGLETQSSGALDREQARDYVHRARRGPPTDNSVTSDDRRLRGGGSENIEWAACIGSFLEPAVGEGNDEGVAGRLPPPNPFASQSPSSSSPCGKKDVGRVRVDRREPLYHGAAELAHGGADHIVPGCVRAASIRHPHPISEWVSGAFGIGFLRSRKDLLS